MSKDDFSARIPLLDGSNWVQWEQLVKGYFQVHQVWKYVSGTALRPEEPDYYEIKPEPQAPAIQPPRPLASTATAAQKAKFDQDSDEYDAAAAVHNSLYGTW